MRALAAVAAVVLATASGGPAGTGPVATASTAAAATPPATPPAAARSRSRTVAGGSPAVLPAPPVPPPLTVAAPPGVRPGPTPGLRRPASCTPPAADEPPPVDMVARRLQLAAVHRLATGYGQVIAVIDTGVHPDARFGRRLRGGGDYVAGGDGLDDCDGHGTAVAGLIAAADTGLDADGLVGIAPAAQLLSIRQSSPSFQAPGPAGLRPVGDVATLADAVVLAVREGAGVVNISEAVCLPAAQAAGQGASIQAALRYAATSDVIVVAAAGNAGTGSCAAAGREPAGQVALPGWYGSDILTVGAVGPDDAPAPFTVPGPWVDVAAPGTGLRSLAVGGGTTGSGIEGTSFAAPWVAGLAALIRERFPQLSAAQVVDRILATARRAPGGHRAAIGHGVVDPVAALTAVPDALAPGDADPAVRAVGPAGNAGLPATTRRPLDLPAASTLLVMAAAAAWLLRRRPAHPRRGRG